MDAFDTTKPDRFQQSLGGAWANFLSAQHCSREVGSLKRSLDEHIHQANLSIASLQRDAAQQHDLVTAAVSESKSKAEQTAAGLARLSTLQHEVTQDKEHALRKFAELSEKVATQQGSLEGVRSMTSQETKVLQEQYRLALEKVESLQGELRELRAEKIASELRLAALEHRIATVSQPHRELPEETVRFLDQILSRQDGLMRLLDKQDWGASTQSLTQPILSEGLPEPRPPVPVRVQSHYVGNEDTQPNATTKKNPVQTQTERPMPSYSQDIRTLYLIFRDRYKTDPPKSDVNFIWEFIGSIESPVMSKHVQESLATILSDYVTRSRDTRRKNPQRHINISRGLTWRKFREALVKIPAPP